MLENLVVTSTAERHFADRSVTFDASFEERSVWGEKERGTRHMTEDGQNSRTHLEAFDDRHEMTATDQVHARNTTNWKEGARRSEEWKVNEIKNNLMNAEERNINMIETKRTARRREVQQGRCG